MSLSKLFGKIPPVPWRLAHLAEIPALGPAAEREYWRLWTDDPAFGRNWRSVRRHFGIDGFGANANEAEAGELLVVPHAGDDHAGQEEIYVLLAVVPGSPATAISSTSARVTCSTFHPR